MNARFFHLSIILCIPQLMHCTNKIRKFHIRAFSRTRTQYDEQRAHKHKFHHLHIISPLNYIHLIYTN